MKKFKLFFTSMFCSLAISLSAQPIINILTEFYSESLDEYRNVRIYLPGDYNTPPANMHYPVIYFLHGWTANHNSISTMLSTLQNLMDNGIIEPVIMVAADNWVEPFGGSVYVNSILWGDYEDYNVNDLVDWIDANYRTIPTPEGRALIGHSMGGFGAFRYGLLHKDKFCAFAANAATVNFDLFMDHIQTQIQIENSGPPYFYSFSAGGEFTQFVFISAGTFSPNYNTPQTYIDPAIVEYPLDESGNLIDTVYQKFKMFDMPEPLHATTPQDSVGILLCCGTNDEWGLYPANAALCDTLDELGLPYEFMSHTGSHTITAAFKQRALMFLDSLLVSPTIPCSCLPEGILITTQSQIDSFPINYPGCTEIEGSVQVGYLSGGYDITNLNGLSAVTSIGGNFNIGMIGFAWPHSLHACPNLTSLEGLSNLVYLGGDLKIRGTGLSTLAGLENLNVIYGDLEIGVGNQCGNNPHLTNIDAIGNIISVGGSLTIAQNDSLTSIASLHDSISIGGSLHIGGNNSLANLNGLSHLTSINEDLKIESNALLENIDDLNNISTIGGSFHISDINALTSLTALENLASVGGWLAIYGNDALTSLTGLENLDSIGGSLSIGSNDALTSLTGLENLASTSIGGIIISHNGQLTNLSGLENITSVNGEVHISYNNSLVSLTGLDNLVACEELCIEGNNVLSNLSGLENLVNIGGDLYFRSSALNNLSGLQNLNIIDGSLVIGSYSHGNILLTSLAGLDNLTSIGGNFEIIQNYSLADISALENLTFLGGNFDLDQNNAMNNLLGLEGLTSIGGGLIIFNSHLNSLMGLNNVTSIGGDLSLGGNSLLSGLTPLESLTYLNGQLSLFATHLLSLEGLENISASSITSLSISSNSLLSTCEVQSICDYLAAPNGTVTIENNAPGCNSPEEVEEACLTIGVEEPDEMNLITISPNPFGQYAAIRIDLPATANVSLQIFNTMGVKVADLHHGPIPAGQQQIVWDSGSLPKGLYFIRVQMGNKTIMEKIIKN